MINDYIFDDMGYSQFLSRASSRTDLYAFNNPCSERSTLTLVISVVGGFVTLEQIFAASVSKIMLGQRNPISESTHHHKFHRCIKQPDHNSLKSIACPPNDYH